MRRIWIESAAVLLAATWCWAAARPARTRCCRTAISTMLDVWDPGDGRQRGRAGGAATARRARACAGR